jgi:hypothetical protein
MKRVAAVVFSFLVVFSATTLSAKGNTTKIKITGAKLATPVEISEPNVLNHFNVWAGPGTWMNGIEGTEGFIIDWSSGAVAERPNTLDAYEVSFYVKYANRPAAEQDDQLAYMVFYETDSLTGQSYVYLPGKADEWYRLNTTAIYRGREGKWFRATAAWQNAVRKSLPEVAR